MWSGSCSRVAWGCIEMSNVERIQRALEIARLQGGSTVGEYDAGQAAEREAIREEFITTLHPVERVSIDRRTLPDKRVVLWDDTSPAASAYRMLRAQVLQRIRANNMTTL